MVSKNLPMGVKIVITVKYSYLVYISRSENLCIPDAILNHIDTKAILRKYGGSCMVYRPEWYRTSKYCQIPIPCWYQIGEILIIDTQMVSERGH